MATPLAPLAPNCQGFVLDANGKVTGVQLGITIIPGAQYEVYSVRLRDEYEAAGQTVANCSVYDKNNIPTGLPVRLTWPGKQPPFQDSGLPGNANNQHVIVNGYAPPNIGPLALHTGAFNAPTSDIVWGLGLPNNRHVSWDVTFREKGSVTVPPPVDPPPPTNTGMPKTRWGVHLIGNREADLQYVERLRPTAVKIVDPDPAVVQRVLNALDPSAKSIVVLRDHPMSEQKSDMAANPVGTGKRHGQEWIAKLTGSGRFAQFGKDKRIVVVGINEPDVHNVAEETIVFLYTKAFLETLTAAGLRGLALNLSVGWPRNTGPGTLPTWQTFLPLESIINAGNHLLCVHEYWYPEVTSGWGNYANRIAACPMSVPILIGECSYTRQLAGLPQPWGWIGNKTAAEFSSMLAYYHEKADARILAIMPFTSGFASAEWQSKDVLPAVNEILARVKPYAWPAVWPPKGTTVPPVEPPTTDKKFRLLWPKMPRISQWYSATHSGLDIAIPTGTPLFAMWNGVVAWSDVDDSVGGGYGQYVRVTYPELGFDVLMGHMLSRSVFNGNTVKRGQLLGYSNNTGNSTGAHLHLEIRMKNPDGSYRAGVGPFSRGQVDPLAVKWALANLYGFDEA